MRARPAEVHNLVATPRPGAPVTLFGSHEPVMPPNALAAVRSQLYRDVLSAYQGEYKELMDTWRNVETKAQATVATSGIFLAAAFAFARDLSTAVRSNDTRVMFALALALLTASVGCAVAALLVRKIRRPPPASRFDLDAGRIADSPDFDEEDVENTVHDRLRVWRRTAPELEAAIDRKGRIVWAAQLLLGLGAWFATVVTVVSIFR